MYCNATLFVQNVEKLIFKVFESLGHWNTAVMVILALHLGPIWLVRTEHCLNTITLLYVTNTMIVAMMTSYDNVDDNMPRCPGSASPG